MAWKDLRKIKTMPIGLAFGTVSKMITGQDMNIKPRQMKRLSDEVLNEFERRQEEEREKLFMVFADHFPAPEDVEKAREDFWGFINYIYGTYTFRSYINLILGYPDMIEALIELYFKNEEQLKELTYNLDRSTEHVMAFAEAIQINPSETTSLFEEYDGNFDQLIKDLKEVEIDADYEEEAELEEDYDEDDAHEDEETLEHDESTTEHREPKKTANEDIADDNNTETMKEAV